MTNSPFSQLQTCLCNHKVYDTGQFWLRRRTLTFFFMTTGWLISEASVSKAFLISEEFTDDIINHINGELQFSHNVGHLIFKRLILKSCCWFADIKSELWRSPQSESFSDSFLPQPTTFGSIWHSGHWRPRRKTKWSSSATSSQVLSLRPFSTRFRGSTAGTTLQNPRPWWSSITRASSNTRKFGVSKACRGACVSPDPLRAASACTFRGATRRMEARTSARSSNSIWTTRANGSRRPRRAPGLSC